MRMSHIVGGVIVSEQEAIDLSQRNRLDGLQPLMSNLDAETSIELRDRTLSGPDLARFMSTAAPLIGEPPDSEKHNFVEIGIGKPLTVALQTAYTGKYPRPGMFGNERPFLLTSAMKGADRGPSPRQIQIASERTGRKTIIHRPKATQQGTSTIYHEPSLVDMDHELTIEMFCDEWDDSGVKKIAKTLTNLSGLAVFAPAAAFLAIGGQLLNIAAALGEVALDNDADWDESVSLALDHPVIEPLKAGYKFLIDGGEEVRLQNAGYRFNEQLELVDEHGKPYDGRYPYLVITIDGRPQPQLADWKLQEATAKQLEPFLAARDAKRVVIDSFEQFSTLMNDYTYRRQAERLNTLLQQGGLTDKQKKLLTKKRTAALENMRNESFKPKFD